MVFRSESIAETIVSVMYDPSDPISMIASFSRNETEAPFLDDDRAMGQLAVLGILLGSSFVLVAALAVFMLAGS